jgi:hypothetical protein
MKRWHLVYLVMLAGFTGASVSQGFHTDEGWVWFLAGTGIASLVGLVAYAPIKQSDTQ